MLARYHGNGSLDSRFGVGGKVRTDTGRIETANVVAMQPDGKILIAGTGIGPPIFFRQTFLLARYREDGALDSGFGIGGMAYTSFAGRADIAMSLALQPDGKIIAAGRAHSNRDPSFPPDFALARYHDDGTPDATFGAGGRVITIIENYSEILGVTVQLDGEDRCRRIQSRTSLSPHPISSVHSPHGGGPLLHDRRC